MEITQIGPVRLVRLSYLTGFVNIMNTNKMCLGGRKETTNLGFYGKAPGLVLLVLYTVASLIPTKAINCAFKQGRPIRPGRRGCSNLFLDVKVVIKVSVRFNWFFCFI